MFISDVHKTTQRAGRLLGRAGDPDLNAADTRTSANLGEEGLKRAKRKWRESRVNGQGKQDNVKTKVPLAILLQKYKTSQELRKPAQRTSQVVFAK